ncbi:glycine-rich cell wall structural protein 1.0-like [Miscanthus floridulus]|uniref:glycine-rich cell wall structural protein 1.0-like n=1 Tax=Miscanthus floridulus TaxID=154761 RepID=UPI003458E59C
MAMAAAGVGRGRREVASGTVGSRRSSAARCGAVGSGAHGHGGSGRGEGKEVAASAVGSHWSSAATAGRWAAAGARTRRRTGLKGGAGRWASPLGRGEGEDELALEKEEGGGGR